MRNPNIKILTQIRNIINHEQFNTPYEWVGCKKHCHKVRQLTSVPRVNRKAILEHFQESYFQIYILRMKKLFEWNAPTHVISNETDEYTSCIQNLNRILAIKK